MPGSRLKTMFAQIFLMDQAIKPCARALSTTHTLCQPQMLAIYLVVKALARYFDPEQTTVTMAAINLLTQDLEHNLDNQTTKLCNNIFMMLKYGDLCYSLLVYFPIFKLSWQSMGSIDRRLRACYSGVQAEVPAPGSPELRQLELFLKSRAQGMPIEGPSLRR